MADNWNTKLLVKVEHQVAYTGCYDISSCLQIQDAYLGRSNLPADSLEAQC